MSAKISVSVDALGNPVRFILTPGQMHDIGQAEDLIRGFSFANLLADKGVNSDWFRARIATSGAAAVIPSTRARSQAIPYDKHIYKARNLVERFLKQNQAFSSHRDPLRETALSFTSMLFVVGAVIWLNMVGRVINGSSGSNVGVASGSLPTRLIAERALSGYPVGVT